MGYLFFDTETVGLPNDYKAPSSALYNWPRMVQLSWILTDVTGTVIRENDHIIYPDGFVIPEASSKLHGITTSIAKSKGDPLGSVIDSFMSDVDGVDYIVGHNVSFDMHIVGAELIRLGKRVALCYKPSICTMQSTIDFCAIPGYYGTAPSSSSMSASSTATEFAPNKQNPRPTKRSDVRTANSQENRPENTANASLRSKRNSTCQRV